MTYKVRINDLELDKKSSDKNLDLLTAKVTSLLEENAQLKRLANSDESTKLRIELKAAKERLVIIEKELNNQNEYTKAQVGQL